MINFKRQSIYIHMKDTDHLFLWGHILFKLIFILNFLWCEQNKSVSFACRFYLTRVYQRFFQGFDWVRKFRKTSRKYLLLTMKDNYYIFHSKISYHVYITCIRKWFIIHEKTDDINSSCLNMFNWQIVKKIKQY